MVEDKNEVLNLKPSLVKVGWLGTNNIVNQPKFRMRPWRNVIHLSLSNILASELGRLLQVIDEKATLLQKQSNCYLGRHHLDMPLIVFYTPHWQPKARSVDLPIHHQMARHMNQLVQRPGVSNLNLAPSKQKQYNYRVSKQSEGCRTSNKNEREASLPTRKG